MRYIVFMHREGRIQAFFPMIEIEADIHEYADRLAASFLTFGKPASSYEVVPIHVPQNKWTEISHEWGRISARVPKEIGCRFFEIGDVDKFKRLNNTFQAEDHAEIYKYTWALTQLDRVRFFGKVPNDAMDIVIKMTANISDSNAPSIINAARNVATK